MLVPGYVPVLHHYTTGRGVNVAAGRDGAWAGAWAASGVPQRGRGRGSSRLLARTGSHAARSRAHTVEVETDFTSPAQRLPLATRRQCGSQVVGNLSCSQGGDALWAKGRLSTDHPYLKKMIIKFDLNANSGLEIKLSY